MPDNTIEVREGEQLDWSRIEGYLRTHIPAIGEGTIAVRQFPSGASNLTYLLRIGTWEGVLRRPPFGPIPPKAHDMQCESNLLCCIHPVFPLVPEIYLFCANLDVMGVPFYVMERRRGIILDDTFPSGITPHLNSASVSPHRSSIHSCRSMPSTGKLPVWAILGIPPVLWIVK